MTRAFVSLPAAWLLLLSGLSTQAIAQTQAPKDPVAFSILTATTAALGQNPTDAMANGTVTAETPSGPETYSVVFKARPVNQFRAEFPSRGSLIVVNGQQGKHVTPTATEAMEPYATYSMSPLMFPFFTILAAYASPDVALTDLGPDNVNGETAHRIELKRLSALGDGLDAARLLASRWDVSISLTSSLPLKIEFEALSAENPTSALPVVCYLSDFRKVGSSVVPFHIEEFASGKRLWSLQLDNVQFNVGLSDSDFAVE